MKWVIIKGVRYPSSVISAFAAYNMDNPFLKVRIRNKYHIVPFDDVNKMASQMVYLMDNYPDFVQIGRWWISKKAVMSWVPNGQAVDGSGWVISLLSEAVDDKMYFKYLLFNLGIVDRWKRESDELIAELEDLCGKKWVNPYTPERERFTLTLTDEERLLIEESIKAGYYSAENIEKRREEAHKAKMMEKRAEICEQYDKIIRNAETDKSNALCV